MKFSELDKKMRVYEESLDQKIIPGIYLVARLDGRGFTKLTKEKLVLEKPYDNRFRDAMIETVKHLMGTGFRVIYGFTESDEISLLFHQEENLFERKTRKILSVLAGEASAKFSLTMGTIGAFDCRLCPLPDGNTVIDYFRWRQEDAHRNSLSAYCYWKLRESGKTRNEATNLVKGISVAAKNELLFNLGINYNELPAWQKRGIGFYYAETLKKAVNPITGVGTETVRKVLKHDLELPMGEAYDRFIKKIMNDNI